jgi:D-psicose/D-tagatose/L-ribulose 3-epimerase
MMTQTRRKFINQLASLSVIPAIPTLAGKEQSQAAATAKSFASKNKVGFNLLLWTASVSDKMNPLAERLKKIGYDGVEVAMGESSTEPYIQFGKYLRSIDLEVCTVLALGKDENPVSESAEIRKKAVDKLKWAVDRANDLGAKNICGPFHSAFATFSRKPPSDDEYKRSAEVLHEAGEYAARSKVVLTPEAINRFECYLCNTISQLSKLVRLTDHPNVRPMFDTHHANIEEKMFEQTIKSLDSSLAHVHISENDRGTPGDGHVHWDKVFSSLSEINYKGWLTIEAFSRNDVDFANSINVWREYNKPWDIATNGFAFIKKMQAKHKL